VEGGSAGLASSQHRVMAAATQLMPSPSGLKSMSAFSPFTDSPSSPAHFANVFSNRSSSASDHLQPPPSPYPATVDPSPVDSNGTSQTDHTDIEDDAQVNHLGDDDAMSDIRSPGTDEIASPASHNSQPKPHRLNTTVPVRTRADSDDAPPSVIHAPASFKDFSRASISGASTANASDNTAVASPSTPEANMLPEDNGEEEKEEEARKKRSGNQC